MKYKGSEEYETKILNTLINVFKIKAPATV